MTSEEIARINLALAIVDSESFMWLMVGSQDPERHLALLRGGYQIYSSLCGGYSARKPAPDIEALQEDRDARYAVRLGKLRLELEYIHYWHTWGYRYHGRFPTGRHHVWSFYLGPVRLSWSKW